MCELASKYKDKYRGYLRAALKEHPWPEAVRVARADLLAWDDAVQELF